MFGLNLTCRSNVAFTLTLVLSKTILDCFWKGRLVHIASKLFNNKFHCKNETSKKSL